MRPLGRQVYQRDFLLDIPRCWSSTLYKLVCSGLHTWQVEMTGKPVKPGRWDCGANDCSSTAFQTKDPSPIVAPNGYAVQLGVSEEDG